MRPRTAGDGPSGLILAAFLSLASLLAPVGTHAAGGPSFGGIPLPTPVPGSSGPQPPGVWLVHGHTAVAASYGSFCYLTGCVDMVSPRVMRHVARATIGSAARLTLVIGAPRLKSVGVTLSSWSASSRTRPRTLAVHRVAVNGRIVLPLPSLGTAHNALLSVFVQFPPISPTTNPHIVGGDATYFWRLNPPKSRRARLAAGVARSTGPQVLVTSTPASVSPTPTATPLPSGPSLIELMRKAMVARRTVRMGEVAQSTWKGRSTLSWTWMDLDLQANAMREVDTTQRTRPGAASVAITTERRELLLSGNVAASRAPGKSWYCERLRGVRVRNGLVPFQLTSADVTTLGAATIAGAPVWHVRATHTVVTAWSAREATVDLFISRSDDTLRRLTLSADTLLGGAMMHVTLTETYSRYGKAVTVTVPQVCR